jgi:hypothetical protein
MKDGPSDEAGFDWDALSLESLQDPSKAVHALLPVEAARVQHPQRSFRQALLLVLGRSLKIPALRRSIDRGVRDDEDLVRGDTEADDLVGRTT